MKHIAWLAAGILMLQAVVSPFANATAGQGQPSGTVTGFVVPNQVGANEPFTFAAAGIVEGDVVQVRTVEGQVVQSKRADKYGRVFLAAGLASGAYLLSAKGGKSTSSFNVQPPRTLPDGNSLSIPQLPGCVDAKQGLSLIGEGMSPNAADMAVKIGKTQFPVLAGTATEMKTGPLPTGACGEGPVEIKNTKTGDTSKLDSVVFYELSAKLSRQKLSGGEQTTLEFTFKPADFTADVNAKILSGPVSFQGGGKTQDLMVVNGKGKLPLMADPAGLGQFQVAYDINEILGAGKLAGSTFLPLKPGGAAGGEKPEPADNKKKQRCPLTKHIRDEATGWETKEKKVPDPANPGKEKTVYMASRTVRCSIHKSCSKEKDHGGACAFTGKNRCKDHDIVETREYDSEQARKDGMKDTGIPDKIKYPG